MQRPGRSGIRHVLYGVQTLAYLNPLEPGYTQHPPFITSGLQTMITILGTFIYEPLLATPVV
jgi:hypothetical protein